jgi:hypothetical protein
MSARLIDVWEQFTGPEPVRPRPRGADWCNPGEPENPSSWCRMHSSHHYCATCVGWYGVPHDMIHGESPHSHAHPMGTLGPQCACRPCRAFVEWADLPSNAARLRARRAHTAAVRAKAGA